jgi:hypothetical protein
MIHDGTHWLAKRHSVVGQTVGLHKCVTVTDIESINEIKGYARTVAT